MHGADGSDWASAQYKQTRLRIDEHAKRCHGLPPLKPGEVDKLIAEFFAKRGGPTKCPTAYLVPLQHGAKVRSCETGVKSFAGDWVAPWSAFR